MPARAAASARCKAVEELVKAAVAEVGATSKAQMGAVMKVVTDKAGGRADGKTLSEAVQKALS